MQYKKVGGLHFVKIGRFGFSFYWSKSRAQRHAEEDARFAARRAALAAKREANLALLRPAPVELPLFNYPER